MTKTSPAANLLPHRPRSWRRLDRETVGTVQARLRRRARGVGPEGIMEEMTVLEAKERAAELMPVTWCRRYKPLFPEPWHRRASSWKTSSNIGTNRSTGPLMLNLRSRTLVYLTNTTRCNKIWQPSTKVTSLRSLESKISRLDQFNCLVVWFFELQPLNLNSRTSKQPKLNSVTSQTL